MQKKIIALAVASAAAGFASAPVFAQSNVSIYGVVDQAVTSQSQANGGSVTSLLGSGYTTERLGFKGTEDMGNGLKANFVLELGMKGPNGNLDNAQSATVGAPAQIFQRMSTVGLSGAGWGSVNFGRQYTPDFSVQAANDIFRVAGVGSIYSLTNVGITRASNSIRYDSVNMNGFSLAAMYALGDTGTGNVSTVSPTDQGRHAGFNLMYNNGPLMLGAGYANQRSAGKFTAGTVAVPAGFAPPGTLNVTPGTYTNPASTLTQKTTSVTGSYDFKVVAINAGWQENKIDNNTQDRTTWNIGGTLPVFGKDSIKLSYADRHDKLVNSGDSKLTALGYVHPMSPRTTLYATYAKMKNDSNAAQGLIFGAPGASVTGGYSPDGFQLGLSHNF